MVTGKPTILVVDDDIQILEIIREILTSEDYEVFTAPDGKAAMRNFVEYRPHLVLLDIRLPDIDGYTICKHIKEISNTPVIMVTGKIEASEEIEGLYAGADDYITKPFRDSILIARVKAMLRRSAQTSESKIFKCGNIEIDFVKQVVIIDGNKIELTSTEFKILAFLALHHGQVVSQPQILKEIWSNEDGISSHILQVNVSRLRKKLNDNTRKYDYIETVQDLGYILHLNY